MDFETDIIIRKTLEFFAQLNKYALEGISIWGAFCRAKIYKANEVNEADEALERRPPGVDGRRKGVIRQTI